MRLFILAATLATAALATPYDYDYPPNPPLVGGPYYEPYGVGIPDFTTREGMYLQSTDTVYRDDDCFLAYSGLGCPVDYRMPQFEVRARADYFYSLFPDMRPSLGVSSLEDAASVPEPASFLLVALAAIGLLLYRRVRAGRPSQFDQV
jgi:hypothetical protein